MSVEDANAFPEGEWIMFTNYQRAEKDSGRPLRRGSKVKITSKDIEEETGKLVYIVEDGKGREDKVYAEELSLPGKVKRVTQAEMKEALEKDAPLSASMDKAFQSLFEGKPRYEGPLQDKEQNMLKELLAGQVNFDGGELEFTKEDESFQFTATDYIKQELMDNPNVDPLVLAVNILKKIHRGYFRLGGVLAYINMNNIYTYYKNAEGEFYTTFRDFVDEKLPTILHRRALYYLRAYVYFTNWGLTEDDIADIGYSSANQLCNIATKANIREWLEVAKKHKGVELADMIAEAHREKELSPDGTSAFEKGLMNTFKPESTMTTEAFAKAEAKKFKRTNVSFKLLPDQVVRFEDIKKKVSEKYGAKIDDTAHIMDIIFTEHLNSETSNETMTPETIINYGETIFKDYDVLLVHKGTGEVKANPRKHEEGEIQVIMHKNEAAFLAEKSEQEAEMLQ